MTAALVILGAFVVLILVLGTRASESALQVRGARRERPAQSDGEALADSVGAGLEDVSIVSNDGMTLRGWLLIPPQWNGAAVIFIHGFTDTRAYLIEQARMFLGEGYASLMIDNRGHGASDDAVVTFGVRERFDVKQWGDWLCARLGLENYFLFGQSMGAVIGMMTVPLDTRIAGYVSEACYTHFAKAALRRLADGHFFGQQWAASILRPVLAYGYLYGRLRYGTDLSESAPEAVIGAITVPVLLIHGTEDQTIPFDSIHTLHALNPKWTETYVVEGARHTECMSKGGEAYRQRVTRFLARLRTARARA